MKKEVKTTVFFGESFMDGVDICGLCGKPNIPKTDKKGRPFIHCSFCGLMAFLHSELSQVGYKVMTRIIKKNLRQHEKLLEDEYRKFINTKPLIVK